MNGGCKAWQEARPAPGEVNGHRERDPRAVAHCTGGPRPRKRGPEDPGLYKGCSQAAGCELFPKLRRLDNYQRARCASRCGGRRPGSSRCAVCAACRLSGAEHTLPPRGGGVIRGALYSCAGRAGLRAALTARDLTPAWSGREESNPARGRVPGRPQAPSRRAAGGKLAAEAMRETKDAIR